MMHYLLAVVGLFVAGNAVSWDAKYVQNFESLDHVSIFQEWKQAFGKSYVGPEQEARKFLIWLDNWRQIIAHNQDYSNTFTKKMNQFGDLTADEFRYYVHGSNGACYNKKSASNKMPFVSALKDGMSKLKAEFPDLAVKDTKSVDVPDSVDWTTEGKVTPVKNQGQCGSCWAFSTTGSLECQYAIEKGTLTSLSEQQLVDCSGAYGNMGCNGGLMDDAFKYVEAEGGLCTETAYPYTAEDGSCKATTCGTKYNANSGYKDVTHDSESSLQAAAAAGCVSIAIEADQSSFQFYSSGILSGRCGTSLDHGVLVVGYGSQGSSDYWKVKNSWGTTWGEQGYVLICRNCDKNGSQGECGILDEPSYPTFS